MLTKYPRKGRRSAKGAKSVALYKSSSVKGAMRITLTDMSWNLHCSTVTLTEHFKKEFGITIMQYVAQKRMEMAEEMLKYVIRYVLEHAPEEMNFFNSFVDKGLLDRLNHVLNSEF